MTTTKDQQQDVVDLLLEQHTEVRSLLGRLERARGEQKRDLFQDLVRLLAVHESAEEQVVHPIARQEAGAKVVDARLHEEDEAKHALAELHNLGVDHPEFDSRLATLATAVLEHAANEEKEEFPQLRRKVSAEQLRRMAGGVRAAEAVAPTRPHPAAGESAIGNLLAGPPAAVFDRMRDAVRDWHQSNKD